MATTAGVLNGPSSVLIRGWDSFLEANEASFQELGPTRRGGKMTAALWSRAGLSKAEEKSFQHWSTEQEGGSQTVEVLQSQSRLHKSKGQLINKTSYPKDKTEF